MVLRTAPVLSDTMEMVLLPAFVTEAVPESGRAIA